MLSPGCAMVGGVTWRTCAQREWRGMTIHGALPGLLDPGPPWAAVCCGGAKDPPMEKIVRGRRAGPERISRGGGLTRSSLIHGPPLTWADTLESVHTHSQSQTLRITGHGWRVGGRRGWPAPPVRRGTPFTDGGTSNTYLRPQQPSCLLPVARDADSGNMSVNAAYCAQSDFNFNTLLRIDWLSPRTGRGKGL